MSIAIYWFSLDLRLHDLPGLAAAMRHHEQVIPVFILDRDDPWFFGGASQWWLHHSLSRLAQDIEKQGGHLVLRAGKIPRVLDTLIQDTGADALYFSRAYEPWLANIQQTLANELNKRAVQCKRYAGRLLLEPDEVKNQQGKPFQVFTPYYKHCLKILSLPSSSAMPKPRWYPKNDVPSDDLGSWHLLPTKPNWAAEFSEWQPGEAGGKQRLQEALKHRVARYEMDRDIPAVEGTSKLSPHLHFGEISAREIWQSVRGNKQISHGAGEPFLRQLIWREFSFYLLHHWPHTPTQPFRDNFRAFPWQESASALRAWQRGETGYPIVDAGMRQLWRTGWMHNRVRLIVASFLTKHLRLHWLAGAEWFWDTLVDADLGNNTAGWQWVAGCGADAAPYFRIFNPVLQGEKFDKSGDYVREWVPELARLPVRYIHQPWQAPPEALAEAGVELGKTYPKPLVVHEQARQAALDAYAQVKQAAAHN